MKITDLVHKVEDFEFNYDGFSIKGKWYKYKTTTPKYAKALIEGLPEVADGLSEQEKNKASELRALALEKRLFQAMAESIQSWDATNEDDQPVAPTAELFESLPEPFTSAFAKHFRDLRVGEVNPEKNPTSPDSLSS